MSDITTIVVQEETIGIVSIPAVPSMSIVVSSDTPAIVIESNEQGPSGPPGATGPAGPVGPSGADGADGVSPVVTMQGDRIAIDGVATGPNLTGPSGAPGADGHSPVVSMHGDQVTVDSVIVGPHLTGPKGDKGDTGTAGYTTLGGQFQFAAVAGAETDYALFAYQVPTGNTLVMRGVWIDTMNTGAAVATTATWLQWALGVGSTAVSLATADAAATKSPAKIPLGNQVFAIADAIGKQANVVDVNLDAPLVVNSGEFVHIILKMPLGTATASQVIRGMVGINGYFE